MHALSIRTPGNTRSRKRGFCPDANLSGLYPAYPTFSKNCPDFRSRFFSAQICPDCLKSALKHLENELETVEVKVLLGMSSADICGSFLERNSMIDLDFE
jgi:hypothetical protein